MSKIKKGMANRNGSSASRAETTPVAVLNREIPTGLGGYAVSPYFIVERINYARIVEIGRLLKLA